jgi:hypothetical protein
MYSVFLCKKSRQKGRKKRQKTNKRWAEVAFFINGQNELLKEDTYSDNWEAFSSLINKVSCGIENKNAKN